MLAASLVFSTPTVIAEQDAENVIELPWKTFRGLQMAHVRKRGTAWTEKDLRLFKNAIMKDGMIDPLEQSMLDKLLADSFTFTIRSRSAPERPPVTITAAS